MAQECTQLDVTQLSFSKPLDSLNDAIDRQKCSKCNRVRKFYCANCYELLVPSLIPVLKSLPVNIQIIRDAKEKASKSSAIPLLFLSPDHIRLYTYPALPCTVNVETSALLFPDDNSNNRDSQCATDSPRFYDTIEWHTLTDVVVIDSCWTQTKKILKEPIIKRLRRISLTNISTIFWRYQFISQTCLSSAEAIYFFLRYTGSNFTKKKQIAREHFLRTRANSLEAYDNRYDDLLFFFAFQLRTIQLANGISVNDTTNKVAVGTNLPTLQRARRRRERAKILNYEAVAKRRLSIMSLEESQRGV